MSESDDRRVDSTTELGGLTDAEFQAELERMAKLTEDVLHRAKRRASRSSSLSTTTAGGGPLHSSLAQAAVDEAQMAAWIPGAIAFLTGIGTDEFTIEYLSNCDVATSYAILLDASRMHTETACKALELHVAYNYPEIVDDEGIQAKMLELEASSELWWKTPEHPPAKQGDRNLSVLHARVVGTDADWQPLYAFGLTLRPTGPAIDGAETDGYLPVAWSQVLVKPPVRH